MSEIIDRLPMGPGFRLVDRVLKFNPPHCIVTLTDYSTRPEWTDASGFHCRSALVEQAAQSALLLAVHDRLEGALPVLGRVDAEFQEVHTRTAAVIAHTSLLFSNWGSIAFVSEFTTKQIKLGRVKGICKLVKSEDR